MTRSVGLVLVLISLAVVGGLFAMQTKSQGPTAPAVTQEEAQALAAAASETFAQVDQVLQADYLQSGTYVGAQLPVGSGVTLATATADDLLPGDERHRDARARGRTRRLAGRRRLLSSELRYRTHIWSITALPDGVAW